MERFLFAAVMLYGPFLWCIARKEPFERYGLTFRFSREMVPSILFWVVATLVPLTFAALLWPTGGLPRDVTPALFVHFAIPGITAAVIEEIFFRGWLQTMLRPLLDVPTRVVATSALFAATHLIFQTRPLFLATFFPGLVMGYLREKHESVLPAILYHALGNVWAIWFFPNP